MAAFLVGEKKAGVDPERICAESFAQFMRAFNECSDEIQKSVVAMCDIVNSDHATEEERFAALDTIAEALFPQNHNGKLGVDLEDWDDREKSPDGDDAAILDAQEATFSEKVRLTLEAKGMTQNDLASAADIGQPAISMMLSRKCRPQRRTIEKIAKALGVAAEELWPS